MFLHRNLKTTIFFFLIFPGQIYEDIYNETSKNRTLWEQNQFKPFCLVLRDCLFWEVTMVYTVVAVVTPMD